MLWTLLDRSQLHPETVAAIEDPSNHVMVSPVAPWEIEIKRRTGRLHAGEDVVVEIPRAGFTALPITLEHAVAAGRLPLHHGDPFDRVLVAQAQLEGLTIVTSDEKIARYQVAVLSA